MKVLASSFRLVNQTDVSVFLSWKLFLFGFYFGRYGNDVEYVHTLKTTQKNLKKVNSINNNFNHKIRTHDESFNYFVFQDMFVRSRACNRPHCKHQRQST